MAGPASRPTAAHGIGTRHAAAGIWWVLGRGTHPHPGACRKRSAVCRMVARISVTRSKGGTRSPLSRQRRGPSTQWSRSVDSARRTGWRRSRSAVLLLAHDDSTVHRGESPPPQTFHCQYQCPSREAGVPRCSDDRLTRLKAQLAKIRLDSSRNTPFPLRPFRGRAACISFHPE